MAKANVLVRPKCFPHPRGARFLEGLRSAISSVLRRRDQSGQAIVAFVPPQESRTCEAAPRRRGTGPRQQSRAVELLERLFHLSILALDRLESLGDARQTELLVRLGSSVHILLLAVALNFLAAVLDLGETEGSRRALQKMTQPRELLKISFGTNCGRDIC